MAVPFAQEVVLLETTLILETEPYLDFLSLVIGHKIVVILDSFKPYLTILAKESTIEVLRLSKIEDLVLAYFEEANSS